MACGTQIEAQLQLWHRDPKIIFRPVEMKRQERNQPCLSTVCEQNHIKQLSIQSHALNRTLRDEHQHQLLYLQNSEAAKVNLQSSSSSLSSCDSGFCFLHFPLIHTSLLVPGVCGVYTQCSLWHSQYVSQVASCRLWLDADSDFTRRHN